MEIKLTLPIYYKKNKKTTRGTMVGLNWYRNAIHFALNNAKIKYHKLIKELLRDEVTPFKDKIGVTYLLYYRNENSDLMNVASVLDKFLLDAIQEVGLLKNDNVQYYTHCLAEVAGEDKKNPRLEVIITDDILGMLKEAYKRQLMREQNRRVK